MNSNRDNIDYSSFNETDPIEDPLQRNNDRNIGVEHSSRSNNKNETRDTNGNDQIDSPSPKQTTSSNLGPMKRNTRYSFFQQVLDELLVLNGITIQQLPESVYRRLFKRFKYCIKKEIHDMKSVGLLRQWNQDPSPSSKELKHSRIDANTRSSSEWNDDIIVLIERLNLSWTKIFQDLKQAQHTQTTNEEKVKKGTQSTSVTTHPPSRDGQGTAQASEELYQTFNLLKHEIQQAILSNFQTFSMHEFQTLLDSIIAYISHKELQYRRIPRKIIEKYIERFIPTINNTVTSSGASFVSFILQQLKRIRETSGKRIDLNLTGRLIAAIFSEVMTRYVIPLPLITFMDDKALFSEEGKPSAIQNLDQDTQPRPLDLSSAVWHQMDGAEDLNSKKYRFLKSYISFGRNFEQYSCVDENSSAAWKKKMLYCYSQDISNLIHLSNELKNRAGSTEVPMVRVKKLDEVQNYQSSFLGARSQYSTKGIVGPVEFNLPLFRNPLEHLTLIKQSRAVTLNRIKSLERMIMVWRSLPDDAKMQLSIRIQERLHLIYNIYRLRRFMRQLESQKIDDIELLETYEELYTERVIHHSQLFHENGVHMAQLGIPLTVKEDLSLLKTFSQWTLEDVSMFQNADELYHLTLQEKWVDELRQKKKFLKSISLGQFKRQIQDGTLSQDTNILQLLALIDEKDGTTNQSKQRYNMRHIETLHTWIRFGYPNESRFKKANTQLQLLMQYVLKDAQINLVQVEEFFLKEIFVKKNDCPGYRFGLEFVGALRTVYEGDGHVLKVSPLDLYSLQQERELKKEAFQELDSILVSRLDEKTEKNSNDKHLPSSPSKFKDESSTMKEHAESLHDQQDYGKLMKMYTNRWDKLLSGTRYNERQRVIEYEKMRHNVMREEEERIQMEYDINLTSLPIPNRSVIASNHYTWLSGLRSSWK